jgi:D-alanine-D-alanine ligase
MPLRVGLTYNLRRRPNPSEGLPEDFYVEFDEEETVEGIAGALRKAGCEVIRIEADERAYEALARCRPDIVFNIAEGLRGESRESHIPAMLEMLDIPYTGSGPLALAISLNKALTHRVLSASGVPSPAFQVFERGDEELDDGLEFPLVVKPLCEGSSKGIRNDSLVRDEPSLRRQIFRILRVYKQPAIAEEFLPGREFTVGIIGNGDPTVLPIVEILLDKLPAGANPLYSYEAKWVWDVPGNPVDIFRCPPEIPKEVEEEIRRISIRAFKALGCRDLCRIDMRMDREGVPRVMEVNPLPGLIPNPDAHSCFPKAARAAGMTYDQLICTILWQALKRYGLEDRFEGKWLVRIP